MGQKAFANHRFRLDVCALHSVKNSNECIQLLRIANESFARGMYEKIEIVSNKLLKLGEQYDIIFL